MSDSIPVEIQGEPVCVIKTFRNSKDMTIKDLAEKAGCSEQVVMRAEQGIYAAIPPAISYLISELSDSSIDELNARYHYFVKNHRCWAQQESPLIPSLLITTVIQGKKIHPFVAWRQCCGYSSRMSFCTSFCIHNSTLTRFEKGTSEYVPDVLYELFKDLFGEKQATKSYAKLQRLYDSYKGKVRGDAA